MNFYFNVSRLIILFVFFVVTNFACAEFAEGDRTGRCRLRTKDSLFMIQGTQLTRSWVFIPMIIESIDPDSTFSKLTFDCDKSFFIRRIIENEHISRFKRILIIDKKFIAGKDLVCYALGELESPMNCSKLHPLYTGSNSGLNGKKLTSLNAEVFPSDLPRMAEPGDFLSQMELFFKILKFSSRPEVNKFFVSSGKESAIRQEILRSLGEQILVYNKTFPEKSVKLPISLQEWMPIGRNFERIGLTSQQSTLRKRQIKKMLDDSSEECNLRDDFFDFTKCICTEKFHHSLDSKVLFNYDGLKLVFRSSLAELKFPTLDHLGAGIYGEIDGCKYFIGTIFTSLTVNCTQEIDFGDGKRNYDTTYILPAKNLLGLLEKYIGKEALEEELKPTLVLEEKKKKKKKRNKKKKLANKELNGEIISSPFSLPGTQWVGITTIFKEDNSCYKELQYFDFKENGSCYHRVGLIENWSMLTSHDKSGNWELNNEPNEKVISLSFTRANQEKYVLKFKLVQFDEEYFLQEVTDDGSDRYSYFSKENKKRTLMKLCKINPNTDDLLKVLRPGELQYNIKSEMQQNAVIDNITFEKFINFSKQISLNDLQGTWIPISSQPETKDGEPLAITDNIVVMATKKYRAELKSHHHLQDLLGKKPGYFINLKMVNGKTKHNIGIYLDKSSNQIILGLPQVSYRNQFTGDDKIIYPAVFFRRANLYSRT